MEMLRITFFVVAIICLPLAMIFIMIIASRTKHAGDASRRNSASLEKIGDNIEILEKNTNSISERNQAIAMKLGITEGIAQERASVLANATPNGLSKMVASPVPVADDRTATATEQTAEAAKETAVAAERSATATERMADAAEVVSKKD